MQTKRSVKAVRVKIIIVYASVGVPPGQSMRAPPESSCTLRYVFIQNFFLYPSILQGSSSVAERKENYSLCVDEI